MATQEKCQLLGWEYEVVFYGCTDLQTAFNACLIFMYLSY